MSNVANLDLCKELSKNYRKEFVAWCNMRYRCNKADHPAYPLYGGRGISVTNSWLGDNGFKKFLEDVGIAPSKKHTLDRTDNDKGYMPKNVRWVSMKIQSNNTSRNKMITYENKTQSLSDWADEKEIKYITLYTRIMRGWSIERALCK
jgi:hypothetical protein